MRRLQLEQNRDHRQMSLAVPIALFVVLCGAILFAISEPFVDAERTGVDHATRSAVERALRHLDQADRFLDEGQRESGKVHIQWAREALNGLLPAPSTTNQGGET